ncbi:TonB-dependent receptor [Novosphingobium sp. PC22D]|uniref:TonB-dependent receptor n=1 Tax=Novosphingobium sp. PC22D TaxID=1962403 RepID=UPI000BF0CCCE|nr:TonB-dependent receptor [Novosphingobium sp. PC22D]PEQ12269.1 TonB-dependent receptor [Novosphingobium sp. PC22D]
MNSFKVTLSIGTAIAALSSMAGSAQAQVGAAPATASDVGPGEIIVTAQRREERLQDIPIQIDAFGTEAIEDAGIKSTADVVAQIPNMTFDRGDTYRSNFITMRGLTQINNADPPIAFVLDGVPQTNQQQLSATLFDLERVEVVKGPQGALYGRNAVGGAINVITTPPTNDFQGVASVSYGRGDTLDLAGGVSGPIVRDVLMVRLSATHKESDGLIKNDFRGDKVDFVDHDDAVRGRLLFTPNEALTVDLRGEYADFKGGSNSYAAVFSGDPNDFVNPQFNFPAFAEGRNYGGTLKIDYDFGGATLTSITDVADYRQTNRADLDFRNPVDSPSGIFGQGFQAGQGQNQTIETFSQEVRLVSDGNQPLRWLVGVNYLSTNRNLRTRAFVDVTSTPDQIDNPALIFADNWEDNNNDAYGVFAQVDYDLGPSLTLTGGIRYDKDKRKQEDVNSGAVRKTSFDRVQPKATLTWKPTDDALVYATFSTGFRSGGYNAPQVGVPVFKAETLENYEIGFKSAWADDRITLNGAIFQMNVKNYQFFYVEAATASQIIDNIDKVRIRGAELELQARPAEGLDVSAAIGLIDSNIRNSLQFPSDEGNKAPRTVPFSSTVSAQYRKPLMDGIGLFMRAEWQHFGKKYWNTDNVAVQDPYNLVNVRLGVEYDDMGVYFFGRNIFGDEYYSEFFQPAYSGLDVAIGYPSQPSSYGIEARIKF